jgi:hypothetical protein
MNLHAGQWVHYNDEECHVYAALIVEGLIIGNASREDGYRLTLEVHSVNRSRPNEHPYVAVPEVRIVENVRFSPARSGHSSARCCWTWPVQP